MFFFPLREVLQQSHTITECIFHQPYKVNLDNMGSCCVEAGDTVMMRYSYCCVFRFQFLLAWSTHIPQEKKQTNKKKTNLLESIIGDNVRVRETDIVLI